MIYLNFFALWYHYLGFGRYAPPSLYRPQFSAPPTVPFRDGAGNDVSDAAYPRYYKKYPYSQTTNSPYYPDSNVNIIFYKVFN